MTMIADEIYPQPSRIAVLIPCYNEEKTIGKVVDDFKKALADAQDVTEGNYIIYVIDNNSQDKTAAIAREHGAVVVTEPKQGKGNVLRTMFRCIEAQCYVIVDGDDTYPAESVVPMCREVLENQMDMVVGDRLSSTYFTENKRPFHNLGNRLVRSLINLIWKRENFKIFDVMTGFRAFSQQFVKSFAITSRGFEIETEMTIHALDKNLNIKNIPVQYRDRPDGSSSKLNTYSDGRKVIFTILRLFKEYKPFLFFGLMSLFIFLISLCLFVPVLTGYLETGLVPRFPSLIVSVAGFIVALQLFICGLMLENLSIKDRKNFELYLLSLDLHR